MALGLVLSLFLASGSQPLHPLLNQKVDECSDHTHAHYQVEDREYLPRIGLWGKIAESDGQESDNAKVDTVEPTPPFDPVVEVSAARKQQEKNESYRPVFRVLEPLDDADYRPPDDDDEGNHIAP